MTLIFILLSGINTVYSFNLSSGRWADSSATILFSSTMAPVNAQELKNGQWVDQVKTAFARWTTSSNVKFDIVYTGEDCGNNCTINNNKNELFWQDPGVAPVNMPAGALAVTLRRQFDTNMVEVDIVINKSFDAVLTPGPQGSSASLCVLSNGMYSNCFDFPSVVTHEIGHLFGLDHSSEDPDLSATDPKRLATMYFKLAPDGVLIPLKTDDAAGIECLYPASGDPYKVDACCLSFSPFDRAPGCSHAFSSKSTQSLDVGGSASGCGYIDDINKKGGGSNGTGGTSNLPLILFTILIPIMVLVPNRLILWRRAGRRSA